MTETTPTSPLPDSAPDQSGCDEETRILSKAATQEMVTKLSAQTIVTPDAIPSTALPPVSSAHVGVVDSGALPIGSRVAEFEITSVVAQGGFGIVYRAWDLSLERTVALKEYLPSSLACRLSDGSVVARSERHQETFDTGMRSFINEAKLLARFDHPALLKVYRFWHERGTAFMVMPLYVGRTLKDTLASLDTPPEQAWLIRIMDGVTQAIAIMHAENCYHRDIAPDNIMLLEESGQPVVLDFGAARKVISDMTQALTVIIKPGYAPIEQYAEMPEMAQGAWTDVYALGAVLHHGVTGKTPPASVSRFINDSYQPLAVQSALLERYEPFFLAAIDAALVVKPQDRPQTMADFRSLLRLPVVGSTVLLGSEADQDQVTQIISGQTQPHVPATRTKTEKPVQARRGLWIGLAVSGALVAAALVFILRPAPQADEPPPAEAAGSSQPLASAKPEPAEPPPPPPPPPYTPDLALERIVSGAAADWPVEAGANKPSVRIGQDQLKFFVKSPQAGFVYVYEKSTEGQLTLLFPNVLDQHNRIAANERLNLPRASWAMVSGGPAGVNKFVVVVSKTALNLDEAGLSKESMFPQFSERIAQALHEAHPEGISPLLGVPKCPTETACTISYGAASFTIQETN